MHKLVRELSLASKRGEAESLKKFWDKVQELGTPLITPIADDPEYCTVTFLWRDQGRNTRDVLVIINTMTHFQAINNNDISPSLMRRILDTDIWELTLRLPSALHTPYQIYTFDDRNLEFNRHSTEWETFYQIWLAAEEDPLNAKAYIDITHQNTNSVLELPNVKLFANFSLSKTLSGKVIENKFTSSVLDNERRLWIYTPPGYSASHKPYPIMVLFDGDDWANTSLWSTIDDLIIRERIPPMVICSVDPLAESIREEELGCNESFVQFITKELMPFLHEGWHITDIPERTIIAGQSFGGLAATFLALRAPDRFGNVLSQSGSFWWPRDEEFQLDQEQLVYKAAHFPQLPIRFYLEAGSFESSVLSSNRHLRDVLIAKGYDVTYYEPLGGHDYFWWLNNIPNALITLTKDWQLG